LSTFVADSTRQLVVRDSANPLPRRVIDDRELLRRFPEASEDLVGSFIDANSLGRVMPRVDDAAVPVLYITQAALAPFESAGNPNDYWEAFYAAYPGSPGLIRLSRVGFDRSSGHAMVFVSHWCGGRCGSGAYTLLSRNGEGWVVIDRWVVVVS
jgi:hypothetical protein